jgi:uncharacterized protein YjgD (DUF1641 family)
MDTLSAIVTVQAAEIVIGQFVEFVRKDEVSVVLSVMSVEIFTVTVFDVDNTLSKVCCA